MFDCDEFLESLTMFPEEPAQIAARGEHAATCEDCTLIEKGYRSKEPVKENPKVRENVLAYAAARFEERTKPPPSPAGAPARVRVGRAVLVVAIAVLLAALGFAVGRATAPREAAPAPPQEPMLSGHH